MVARLIIRTVVWSAGIGALLLACAGTWRWMAAWWFVITLTVLALGGGVWLMKTDIGLFEERMQPMIQDGQPAADRIFLILLSILCLAWLAAAGLDHRFGWSDMAELLVALGVVLTLAGFAISFRVLRENSFAAPVIKMQAARGHRVIDTGPYSVVRHPMYSGAALFFVGISLWLGSWWSTALSAVIVALFGWRATIEENALRQGLAGYGDYTTRVRYRLVPGVW
jgi:protein-S-isoprenylcysteine O-methyltransferase Ste14